MQEKEVAQVKNSVQQYENDRVKLNELEIKQYNSDSEIHKLNKSIELYTKKVGRRNGELQPGPFADMFIRMAWCNINWSCLILVIE